MISAAKGVSRTSERVSQAFATNAVVALVAVSATVLTSSVSAQSLPATPPSLVTPNKVESRLGTLDFSDGVPSRATAERLYDNLDLTHAYRAYMDNLRGVSIHALRKGMQDLGVKDNEVLIFSQLMDAKSLFLTANADTIYVMGSIDLSKGPVVIETPPQFLGVRAMNNEAGNICKDCTMPCEMAIQEHD